MKSFANLKTCTLPLPPLTKLNSPANITVRDAATRCAGTALQTTQNRQADEGADRQRVFRFDQRQNRPLWSLASMLLSMRLVQALISPTENSHG